MDGCAAVVRLAGREALGSDVLGRRLCRLASKKSENKADGAVRGLKGGDAAALPMWVRQPLASDRDRDTTGCSPSQSHWAQAGEAGNHARGPVLH